MTHFVLNGVMQQFELKGYELVTSWTVTFFSRRIHVVSHHNVDPLGKQVVSVENKSRDVIY